MKEETQGVQWTCVSWAPQRAEGRYRTVLVPLHSACITGAPRRCDAGEAGMREAGHFDHVHSLIFGTNGR